MRKLMQTSIMLTLRGATVGAAALALVAGPALAEKKYDEGASDTEIKIGQTMPYSGNLSAYGAIGRTEAAVFQMINDQGGINGRKITFISLDDAYSPPKTVEMTRKLVEEEKVLFTYHQLGTAPNTAIQKYMNTKKVPQLFVATGASKWGNPKEFPWTMGWQPDYATEGLIYAKHILATVKDPKIGVLMQNDDYGKDYFNGFKTGLGKDNEKLIVQLATYESTDPTVESQMIQLKNSGANVFFNITTPKFAAQAIKKAAELGWKPAHYINNVSASFGSVFIPAGIDAAQDVITAMYFKDVTDPKWANSPDYITWRAFMAKYMPNAELKDSSHVTGYSVAMSLVQVLGQCGDDLTRENVMKQAASLKDYTAPLLLPGIKLNTSATNFYPIRSVQLGRVKGNSLETFGDVMTNTSE